MAMASTSITMSSSARQGSGVSADAPAPARELARRRMADRRLAVGRSASYEKIISLS